MEIPYFFLLLLYALLLLVYFVFAGFNVYHVVRFGFFDPVAKLMTFGYLFSIVVVLIFTALLLWGIDWAQTMNFSPLLSSR